MFLAHDAASEQAYSHNSVMSHGMMTLELLLRTDLTLFSYLPVC